MNTRIKIIGSLLAIAAVATLLSVVTLKRDSKPTFGGLLSDTYTYKNINSSHASSTKGVMVKGGAGTLNLITIGSSSPSVALGLRIYDGAATSSTDRTATSSGTFIGKLKPSSAEGTYWFNASVRKGVVIDVPPGFDGDITVMTQ